MEMINNLKDKYYNINEQNSYHIMLFLYKYFHYINYHFTKVEKYNIINKIYKNINYIIKNNKTYFKEKLNNDLDELYQILVLLINLLLTTCNLYYVTQTNNNYMRPGNKNEYFINNDSQALENNIIIKNKNLYKFLFNKLVDVFNENDKSSFTDELPINDDLIIKILYEYTLKINNKYFKFNGNDYLLLTNDGTYINKNFRRIKNIKDNFILGNYLYHKEDDYCFISDTELIILINYKTELLVIQFNIKSSSNNFILTGEMFINLMNVNLSSDLIKYPFLAYAPKLSLNFVGIDDLNNIGVYCITNYIKNIEQEFKGWKSYKNDGIYNNITHDKQTKEYIYLSIKDNYLTPILNNSEFIKKLDKMYSNYGQLVSYINNESYNVLDMDITIQAYSLEKIEQILESIDGEINNILRDISLSQAQAQAHNNLYLVNWLNNQTEPIVSYNDNYGINATYNCKTDCKLV
jgi:hypothetical protein